MQGRLGALAIMVGIAALPLQATPVFADTCLIVGGSGSFLINDGGSTARSWQVNVDGLIYQSDQFDKLTKEVRTIKVKVGGKSKKVREVVFTFKDTKGITRTSVSDGVKVVDTSIKGEVNENLDSGFVTVKDRTGNREYRIDDPALGQPLNCG